MSDRSDAKGGAGDASASLVKPLTERKEAFANRQATLGKGVAAARETGARAPSEGTGPANRHGLPQLPVGQRAVSKWPVLDLGDQPEISRADWRLQVDGLVERPLNLTWSEFLTLPQVDEESDFHCVTTWSRMDMRFRGVRVRDLVERAGALEAARFIFVTAYDEDPSSGEPYTTNLSLEAAMKSDVLLVHSWDGRPLPVEHGGPCRMVTPQQYAWKGAKWIRRITLRDHDERGFWEKRGYSNSANPWANDRYARAASR